MEMGTEGGECEVRASRGPCVQAAYPVNPLRNLNSPRICMWLKKMPRSHIQCVKSLQWKAL